MKRELAKGWETQKRIGEKKQVWGIWRREYRQEMEDDENKGWWVEGRS
jgi:hypothetical protein